VNNWIYATASALLGSIVIWHLIPVTAGLAGPFAAAHHVAATTYATVPVLSALGVFLFIGWRVWSEGADSGRRR